MRKGKTRGLRRYLCKACGRTFNTVTGTPLQELHKKERWLSFGESLAEGETVETSVQRCGIAHSPAFRWRHQFLDASRQDPETLRGDRGGGRDLSSLKPERQAEYGPVAPAARRRRAGSPRISRRSCSPRTGRAPINMTHSTLRSARWRPAAGWPKAPPNPTIRDRSSESLSSGLRGRSSCHRCSETEP